MISYAKAPSRVRRSVSAAILSVMFALSAPVLSKAAQAPASPALTKIIAKAAARGDVKILTTTLLLALETEPEAAEALVRRAIEAMPGQETALLKAVVGARPELADVVMLPGKVSIAQRQQTIAAAKAAEPKPGFFDTSSWSGEATIGGSIISGNTEEQAVNAGLTLDRKVGKWEHGFTLLADYSRNNGQTTKQRLAANYGSKWFAWERGYVFGLIDFEYDDFLQFDYRLSEAIGVGYRVLQTERMTLDIEGGPGARQTQFEIGGMENEFIFVLASDYDFQIREGLKFTNDTSAFLGSDRSTFNNIAALTAQLTERISGRFSFEAQHDTSVPVGQVRTETATRASLVYGF
jgi:putative salt-induced outer membrane protein